MKQLKNCVSLALLLLCSAFVFAQDQIVQLNEPDLKKPKQFSDLPQKMDLKVSNMESLFRHKVGTVVSVNVTNEFLLEGTVVSKSQDAQVESVVIRSTNRPGALFTYTKTVTKEQGERYVGRMVSRYSGDAFEIIKEKGQYVLIKKDYYEMINE
jgi:hypothetical protein